MIVGDHAGVNIKGVEPDGGGTVDEITAPPGICGDIGAIGVIIGDIIGDEAIV